MAGFVGGTVTVPNELFGVVVGAVRAIVVVEAGGLELLASVTGQTVVVTMVSVVTVVPWAGQLVTVEAHDVMVRVLVRVMVLVVIWVVDAVEDAVGDAVEVLSGVHSLSLSLELAEVDDLEVALELVTAVDEDAEDAEEEVEVAGEDEDGEVLVADPEVCVAV